MSEVPAVYKDESLIPPGEDCYWVFPIREGEVLSSDGWRYGKELREFRHLGNSKEVLCPYWERTSYGTVRCNFVDIEVVDDQDDDAKQKIAQRFGTQEAVKGFEYSWELPEQIKICGIREDEPPSDFVKQAAP